MKKILTTAAAPAIHAPYEKVSDTNRSGVYQWSITHTGVHWRRATRLVGYVRLHSGERCEVRGEGRSCLSQRGAGSL